MPRLAWLGAIGAALLCPGCTFVTYDKFSRPLSEQAELRREAWTDWKDGPFNEIPNVARFDLGGEGVLSVLSCSREWTQPFSMGPLFVPVVPHLPGMINYLRSWRTGDLWLQLRLEGTEEFELSPGDVRVDGTHGPVEAWIDAGRRRCDVPNWEPRGEILPADGRVEPGRCVNLRFDGLGRPGASYELSIRGLRYGGTPVELPPIRFRRATEWTFSSF